jgi:hypothetical protein
MKAKMLSHSETHNEEHDYVILEKKQRYSKIYDFFWLSDQYNFEQITTPLGQYHKTQLIYRFTCFLTLLGLLVALAIYLKTLSFYNAFTLWTLTMTIIYFGFSVAYTLLKIKVRQNYRILMWKATLILFETAIISEIIVSIIFWGFLYKDEVSNPFKNIDKFNLHSFHTLPIISLSIDYFTNYWIFKYSHVVITTTYILIYGIFNCIYVLVSGNTIYPILTWKDVMTFVYIFMITLIIVGFHFLFTWLSMKKLPKYAKPIKSGNTTTTEEINSSGKKLLETSL